MTMTQLEALIVRKHKYESASQLALATSNHICYICSIFSRCL